MFGALETGCSVQAPCVCCRKLRSSAPGATNRTAMVSVQLSARNACLLVIAEGMKRALVGMSVGIAGAIALGGALSRVIFSVKATDPPTYAIVVALLAVIGLLACIGAFI